MPPSPTRVLIFDTTLRDGEQSPGASMNLEQKVTVARALADLGVDVKSHLKTLKVSEPPKRSAGEGYFPFRWELSPLIDTIWLSEGFGQYAAADALSDVLPPAPDGRPYRDVLVEARFRNTLREMPDFLKRMPLVDLSRTASTMYSEDFRTGRTVFSRGGLMAHEMDQKIRGATAGAKRLRDSLRALVAWSAREKRAFRIDELPSIIKDGTGVETRDIMERWLAGMP